MTMGLKLLSCFTIRGLAAKKKKRARDVTFFFFAHDLFLRTNFSCARPLPAHELFLRTSGAALVCDKSARAT